jgi:hypothetical protein
MSYVFDNSASVAFAIMISIFAVSVNFFWQRQEIRLQYEWDMVRKKNNLSNENCDFFFLDGYCRRN